MAKRFTDSDKWKKDWFLNLSPHHKLLWLFVLDICDHAGICDFNAAFFSACLGFKVTRNDMAALGGKVVWIEDRRFHIPSFIAFQYPKGLNPANKVHRSIITLLSKVENQSLQGALEKSQAPWENSQGAKDKDTDKDKEKNVEEIQDVEDKRGILKGGPALFEKLWAKYPNKDGKKEAARHFSASVKTESDWINIQQALENYLKSENVRRGFIKKGATWFNNWQDWIDFSGLDRPKDPNAREVPSQADIDRYMNTIPGEGKTIHED